MKSVKGQRAVFGKDSLYIRNGTASLIVGRILKHAQNKSQRFLQIQCFRYLENRVSLNHKYSLCLGILLGVIWLVLSFIITLFQSDLFSSNNNTNKINNDYHSNFQKSTDINRVIQSKCRYAFLHNMTNIGDIFINQEQSINVSPVVV